MCQEGLEPPTLGLEGRCSIQLSYWHTFGAGDGNRTHVAGLEGQNSTIELHPQHHNCVTKKKYRGGGIRTPGPMVPNHVLYQTEPHPVATSSSVTKIIIAGHFQFGKSFFKFFCTFFKFFLNLSSKSYLSLCNQLFNNFYSLLISTTTMTNHIFFFHGQFSKSFLEFLHIKQWVITKTTFPTQLC